MNLLHDIISHYTHASPFPFWLFFHSCWCCCRRDDRLWGENGSENNIPNHLTMLFSFFGDRLIHRKKKQKDQHELMWYNGFEANRRIDAWKCVWFQFTILGILSCVWGKNFHAIVIFGLASNSILHMNSLNPIELMESPWIVGVTRMMCARELHSICAYYTSTHSTTEFQKKSSTPMLNKKWSRFAD